MEPDDDDQLSNLRIVVKDDQKIIAAARWLPRVELRCRGKTCRLLGGHQACTNAIMVWCTCPERDSAHPDSSRLMALDAWVVEHCRGENLDDYESQEDEEEEDEEGQGSKVDALCMGEAMVLRAGPNVLPKPIPLRRLLASNLVAQGGNRGLKGACFWVYWYDQPIPCPSAPEYAGMGRTWAPGPLAQQDLGVWYKAKIIKCDTTSGEVKIRYDIDGNEDTLYLLVAFAHFGMEPPTHGSPPEVLPDMDLVESLGLPQSAAGSLSASAGSKGKGRAAAAAATPKKVAATKPAATAVTAAKPQAKQQVKGAASPDKQPGRASAAAAPPPPPPPPQPAAAPGSLQRAPSSTSAVTLPAAEAGAGAAGVVVGVKQVVPLKVKPPAKRPSSPSAVPLPPKPPSAKKQPPQQQQQQQPIKKEDAAPARLAVPAAPAAGGAAAPPTGVPGSRVGPVTRPAKRPRHEFELVPLAAGSGQGPAASGAATTATATTTWPPPPLSAAAWAEREERVRRGRRGFVGFLCGRQEQVPVPVFNEVDSAPPPAPSEYLSAADFEGRLAAALSEARRRQPAVAAAMEELQSLCERAQPRWGQSCGKTYHDVVRQRESNERTNAAAGAGGGGTAPDPSPESSYGPDGRLLVARPLGVHECSPTCASASCRANMTLSRGVQRPLEVFRSRDGAWSLRCAEALEPGELVAPLLGRLVPAAQLVEELGAGPEGLPGPPGVVLLNRFFALWEAAYTRGLNWCDRHVRLWQLPPNPLTSALRNGGGGSSGGGTTAATAATTPNDDDPARPAVKRLTCMLALDTRHVGNVARFVRQWAAPAAAAAAPPLGPALVAQPVLAGGCRSPLLYYVGLFAARRVEAGEELSCDFSVMALGGVGPGGVAGPAR
ncbi:hypothetical protein PLESTB_001605500 [Pleodorina starrii]|uniref:SET domain-containing protein n=1 Tax=Pleodorina starrii TaxID=330485 RepID=A0A9W6F8K8_9CHLO|nr:hypothetical protein PLESTB_001605500 [Pleodorina starrii]